MLGACGAQTNRLGVSRRQKILRFGTLSEKGKIVPRKVPFIVLLPPVPPEPCASKS